MKFNTTEMSNSEMINLLDEIIQQESWKLENDKNTGLLAQKSKLLKIKQSIKETDIVTLQNAPSIKEKKIVTPQNVPPVKDLNGHSLKPSHSCDRISEIERLANIFTQSPSYFTTNNNDSSIDNQVLPPQKNIHNELNTHKVIQNNAKITSLITPDIKVKRNVRFGEYSPLHPANKVNSQPFLGVGEYDVKREKKLELQNKQYISRDENNNPKQSKSGIKTMHNQDITQLALFTDGVELCTRQIRETNRLKQDLYRFELNKQIEEKRQLKLEQKIKEQMEDEAIEKTLKEQEKLKISRKKVRNGLTHIHV